jgi:hypothetical protein
MKFSGVGLTLSVGKPSPAAWTLAVEALVQCRKGRGLRERHDGLECERSTMGIVAIGYSARGMAKDFDR